jgi:hypothetical protein
VEDHRADRQVAAEGHLQAVRAVHAQEDRRESQVDQVGRALLARVEVQRWSETALVAEVAVVMRPVLLRSSPSPPDEAAPEALDRGHFQCCLLFGTRSAPSSIESARRNPAKVSRYERRAAGVQSRLAQQLYRPVRV